MKTTYVITYKSRFHPSVVRADLASLASLTAGEFTHDGGHRGTVTCPQSYEWLVDQRATGGMVQSSTKK